MISSEFLPKIADIISAADRIKPHIHKTPVLTNTSLNALISSSLYFKCENFQKVGAFKIRGATNAMLLLSPKEKQHGVVTHSSGNHAQAIALAAKWFGLKAYVVMPENSSVPKKEAVAAYGAKIIFCGPTQKDREDMVIHVQSSTKAHFIHPYDDNQIICGQATVAKELLEEVPKLDYIIAPIGGGGLICGSILAAQYLSPSTKVIGVEPEGANDALRSLQTRELQYNASTHTICDGLRASISERTFTIIANGIESIITVSDEEVVVAMRLIWERMKIIIESSSAVVVAGILKQKEKFSGKKVGVIISGGNVDLACLPF